MADIDSSVDILMVEDQRQRRRALTLHELAQVSPDQPHPGRARRPGSARVHLPVRVANATRDITEQPHVILLDIKLPFVDGLEILRRIKQDQRTRTMPGGHVDLVARRTPT